MEYTIRAATLDDLPFLSTYDIHIAPEELAHILSLGRILLLEYCGSPIGWLRWGMFWDNVPFMNLLYLLDGHRRKGLGRALVTYWEDAMRDAGHPLVMTSTQANEDAQHFYRRIGYRDIGGFTLPDEPFELILLREL